jgi:hypothetical protein
MRNRGSEPSRAPLRRDLLIAFGLLCVIVALLLLAARSGEGRTPDGATFHDPRAHVEARIPADWRAIRRPIDGVIYPPQVLAAASYPVRVPHHPIDCHPGRVLAQMPADGVLLQVFEYAPRDEDGKPVRVPRLPPRPSQFSYGNAEYGPFECAGLSYKFVFEQGGRAFQAHVWFDRSTVDPLLRAQALKILDSFRPTGAPPIDLGAEPGTMKWIRSSA